MNRRCAVAATAYLNWLWREHAVRVVVRSLNEIEQVYPGKR